MSEGVTHRASEWAYRGLWSLLTSYFRVPEQPPTLPDTAGNVISFRPSEGYLRYLRFWFWLGLLVIDVAILVGWLILLIFVWWLALLLLPLVLIIAIVPDIIAFLALHLRYDTTWYVMSERSLRIRRGIWSIHETTITFENVQNVKIQQGPVQRHFGFANLIVETAGGGSGGEGGAPGGVANKGIIEGIDNAQELRDQILKRLRRSKSAGLGDEDDLGDEGRARFTEAHLELLRGIRDEVQRLSA
jgi:membrane protein YdbS with pleckstrin-like domain